MHRGTNFVVVAGMLAMLVAALPGTPAEAGKRPPPPPPPTADPAIAYTCSGNLMVMDADGSNQTTLLAESAKKAYNCYDPSWSPDGNWIVFAASYPENGIYMIKKDGTGLCEVIAANNTSWMHPQWSPDGQYILYSDHDESGFNQDIYLVEAVSGADLVVNLTDTADENEAWPTWSPDGKQFAAQVLDGEMVEGGWEDSDVVVFDLKQQDAEDPTTVYAVKNVNLTDSGTLTGYYCLHMDWAKTSGKIAVDAISHDAAWAYERDLFVIDLSDPDNPANLTQTSTVWDGESTWSPDDSHIAWLRSHLSDEGIWVMDADGSDGARIATAPQGLHSSLHQPDWRHN